MTEKMITLTGITFSIDKTPVARGVLIGESVQAGECSATELLAGGCMQMGKLYREPGFCLSRAEAQMAGVGSMEAVFCGSRFLLGKVQNTRRELFAPLRRFAVR